MTVAAGAMQSIEHIPASSLWRYYEQRDNSEELARIKPVAPPKDGCVAQRPSRLHPTLLADRDKLFTIALCPLNEETDLHVKALQSIYTQLTGKTECPRHGKHWGDIGFQGKDPATDLRGGGIFGLIQLMEFLEDPRFSDVVQSLYRMSLDEVTGFPFAVLGINATGLCMRALREGKLTRDINRRRAEGSERGALLDVVSDYYAACFILYERRWRQGVTNMMDAGPVWREIQKACVTKPRHALRVSRRHNSTGTPPASECSSDEMSVDDDQSSTCSRPPAVA